MAVGGTKPDLIWRLLGQVGVEAPPPPPSTAELGLDYDVIFDEWQNVHPNVSEISLLLVFLIGIILN